MPYFTFKISSGGSLQPLDSFADYRSAKKDVTRLRKLIAPTEDYTVRMILAKDSREAQRLLSETREPRPLGEDG